LMARRRKDRRRWYDFLVLPLICAESRESGVSARATTFYR
jgi:hypothetical protein